MLEAEHSQTTSEIEKLQFEKGSCHMSSHQEQFLDRDWRATLLK